MSHQLRASTHGLRSQWVRLKPISPKDHIGYFKIFISLKSSMDLFPTLPMFQLQVGQSCSLPLVSASKYGLLGLEEDLLFLTDYTDGEKVLHKAIILFSGSQEMSQFGHLNNDITSLQHITHFDASWCKLLSGHLEQLAIACPNLLELNLLCNKDCLRRLQGLYTISANCKNLQGLHLVGISVVESHIWLWEILVDLKLTYLAIELCALLPRGKGKQTMKTIFGLHQKCVNLKALQFGCSCESCHLTERDEELSSLSNFPSLMHVVAGRISNHPTAVQNLVSSCVMLKYLNYTSNSTDSSCSCVVNSNLEELCLSSDSTKISDIFMESISTHGGLVHVVLLFYSVTGDGITTLIENSPKLLTCKIYAQHIYESMEGIPLNLLDFKMTLKERFRSRRLFSCGNYHLVRRRMYCELDNICTDVASMWSNARIYRYW